MSFTVLVGAAQSICKSNLLLAKSKTVEYNAGLTFGKAIAGILAHSKGKSIGIYEDKDKSEAEIQEKKDKEEEMGVERVSVFGMKVHFAALPRSEAKREYSYGKSH